MPTRFKSPKGIQWRGVVQRPGQSPLTKLFGIGRKEKQAAVEWEIETKKLLKEQQEQMTHTALPTVLDWANRYCTFSKQNHSPKHFKEQESTFRRFLSATRENDLWKITPALVMDYMQKQCTARSGNAANKDKKNLAAAWTYGEKFIDDFPQSRNPFQTVAKFKEEHVIREMPTEADFWQVVNTAAGQDKVMLLTYFYLAARKDEGFRLKWSDVDFQNEQVRLGTRKTKDGSMRYDWLPMTQALKNALARWKEERPYKNEWVFTMLDNTPSPNHNPGGPFKVRAHFMKTICRRAGVKQFGFHGIRHLVASIMFHEGRPITDIQRFLRHTSPMTTVRYLRKLGCESEYRDRIMPVLENRQLKMPGILQFEKRNPQDGHLEGSDTQTRYTNYRDIHKARS